MKQCPQCNQVYADDTLNFCLSDGTGLARLPDGSEETIAIDRSSASEATVVLSPPVTSRPSSPLQSPQPVVSGVNHLFAYLSIGLIALILGGALIFWLKSDNRNSPMNVSQTNSAPNSAQTADQNGNIKAQQDALEQERQRLADERRRLDSNKAQSSVSTSRPAATSGGTWFIVLGSFPKSQTDRANQRLTKLQGLGIEASIVDTDNYPGFRGGLSAVVLGPFSKTDARSRLASLKSAVPDAYAKSGY